MKVVLASGNQKKIRELTEILAPLAMEVVPQSAFDVQEAEETGLTFVENAIIKARNAARATGRPPNPPWDDSPAGVPPGGLVYSRPSPQHDGRTRTAASGTPPPASGRSAGVGRSGAAAAAR